MSHTTNQRTRPTRPHHVSLHLEAHRWTTACAMRFDAFPRKLRVERMRGGRVRVIFAPGFELRLDAATFEHTRAALNDAARAGA